MERNIRPFCEVVGRGFLVATLAAGGIAFSATDAQGAPPLTGAAVAKPAVAKAASANGEPPIGGAGVTGDYLRAVHHRLHGGWMQDFVSVAATHPTDHPLNAPTRQVSLAISIRWDGTVAERSVTQSSGAPEFDRAAMDIVRRAAPLPLPPADVISDDGFAHLEWTFARDHRGCSAGARLTRVDDPLEVSLPRLVTNHRVGEALRRVGQSAAAPGAGPDVASAGLDRFARLYLGRTVFDPMLNVAAAFALAETGDRGQVGRLRAALGTRATMEVAAAGLHKLGMNICEVNRDTLATGTAAARELAIDAARVVAEAGGDISACRPSLTGLLGDARQPAALRLKALDVLVTFTPAATVRPVVMATLEDKDPAVRGAALLASVRKGVGRPEMYRLAPLLHDKAVEVRGAASAGMVRAGGDLALEQLYLLGRETDPRPGTWVAAELAQLSSRPSAEFLGKMLKKTNAPVQVAAARALAGRKDAGARAEADTAKSDDRLPSEVRTILAADPKAVPATLTAATSRTPEVVRSQAAIEPVRQLLKGQRNADAAAWLLENFQSLEPRAAIDVLGLWLLRQPATAAAPGAPGAPAAPASATPAAPSPAGTSASNALAL